ncbi:MAG: hypothetical protein AAF458_11560 [Pseudomonadota bacterium]
MSMRERDTSDIFPADYVSWHHCITVKCRVPLTSAYLEERIATLSDSTSEETQRFVKRYGTTWHQQVLSWFRRAAAEG